MLTELCEPDRQAEQLLATLYVKAKMTPPNAVQRG